MPRPPVIVSNEYPYHIWARSNNKEWFDLPAEECHQIFMGQLKKTQDIYKWKPHLLLTMGNHFHLIAETPLSNISSAMRYFMTESSRKIRNRSLRTNHVFGGRYRSSLITEELYYYSLHKYILRNPVEAKICERVELYPNSSWFEAGKFEETMRGFAKPWSYGLPLDNSEQYLAWLNEAPPDQVSKGVRKGLRKMRFTFPKTGEGRRIVNWAEDVEPYLKRRVAEK